MERVVSVRRAHGVAYVTLTDGRVLKLPSAVYQNHRLYEGEPFDDDARARLMALFAYPAALERAAKLLSEKDYSEGEIKKKLAAACYDEETVSRVLLKLKAAGYLSDARFAGLYAQSRMKKHGRARVMQELRRKGVGAEDVKDALDAYSEEDELQTAAAQAKKLLKNKAPSTDDKRRALAALARRGFSYSVARKALESVLGADDNDLDPEEP